MNPESYGDHWADIYDDLFAPPPDAMLDLLAELAGSGPALELAVGAGRTALPLAQRGVAVYGLDVSEPMVARLRAKPGGEDLPVTIGDMRDFSLDRRFRLVYLVFNSLFMLTEQEEQVQVFLSVARHLEPGGVFVIEPFVPDLGRFDRSGSRVGTLDVGDTTLQIEASRHDLATQRVRTQRLMIDQHGLKILPVEIRYAWPAELDLMARLAGLRLRHRWGGWNREPFISTSEKHVSVYEQPG